MVKFVSDFLWIIPFLPLFGFMINGLWGSKLSRSSVHFIGCISIFVSFVISALALVALLTTNTEFVKFPSKELGWITSFIDGKKFSIPFGLRVDALSAIMINIVSGVGFLIHFYSIGYMKGDPGVHKFFAYLNLFCFSMLILVMADNIVLMFLGWEGVGLCSYLLIGFWYDDINNSIAGKKAFIVNRIGDFGFLLGIFLLFQYGVNGDLTFTGIAKNLSTYQAQGGLITIIALLLFLGATGKSSQIPLYTWLPDAMAGPTPVSALIHAATMVTAGVYMIGRMHFLFSASEVASFIVIIIGACTALYAGTIAITQKDIKKVLAYSTISQLGYMFMAMGAGAYAAGIFHLMTHAFFKALLFLGAGSVIIACHHEQDMFKMGGLKSKLKTTYWTLLIGAFALSGFVPFISGFLSKDQILECVCGKGSELPFFGAQYWGYIFWGIGVLAAWMTTLYIWRLIGLTFHGKTRMSEEAFEHVHETPLTMRSVLVILAFLSLFGGLIGIPEIFGTTNHFSNWLNSHVFKPITTVGPVAEHHIEHGFMPWILMAIAAGGAFILYLWIYFRVYKNESDLPDRISSKGFGKLAYNLSLNKYYIDEIYDFLFVNSIYNFSVSLWKWFDVKVIDGTINGLAKLVSICSDLGRRTQTGNLNFYALMIILGTLILFIYFMLN